MSHYFGDDCQPPHVADASGFVAQEEIFMPTSRHYGDEECTESGDCNDPECPEWAEDVVIVCEPDYVTEYANAVARVALVLQQEFGDLAHGMTVGAWVDQANLMVEAFLGTGRFAEGGEES